MEISVFKPQNPVALVASPGVAVWTPAPGNRFRLMRVLFTSSVTGNIVLTDAAYAGGVLLKSDQFSVQVGASF
jgi:hypothetical protein